MRSGWPHTEDGQGKRPADQRQVPFGPEVSWPTGYSDLEYRDGDYRYAAPRAAALSAAAPGEHPYAAFTAAGYGDDGYSDPGYQGPSAQDAGIAATRTVRGFVEPGQGAHGYSAPQAGYGQPGYPEQRYSRAGHSDVGYADSSYAVGQIEMAYPGTAAPAPEAYRGADNYQQPWDYDQPLRYEGEEDAYPGAGTYHPDSLGHDSLGQGSFGPGSHGDAGSGGFGYQQPGYDTAAAYNGSEYSMPGIDGPGYDLSGIIGTSDFEVIGYDEPSYGRLSYDDPRYDDAPRFGDAPRYDGPSGYAADQGRFTEPRFNQPAFDETRLDNLWLSGEDVRREAEAVGYGNDGFGDSPIRSGYSEDFDLGQRAAFNETRFDMRAVTDLGVDHTRFDVPAFDETRLDNLRVTGPGMRPRAGAATALAPAPAQPRSWAEDTSLDHFADLDLTDEPVPVAFTRTLDRPRPEEDTATRRAIGRRRGRSGDRRQWMALGAIAIVAAGAIGGVLMKFKFSGPSGPTHDVAAAASVDGYTRSTILEKEMNVASLARNFTHSSGGQVSDVTSAVYEKGATGSAQQIFMFVGGKLASSDAGASVANFEAHYPNAASVNPGALGGDAACTQTSLGGEGVSMCVFFDNDTFGAFVSPTMTTDKLAATMNTVRPDLETVANSAR
jgi:hypothetical protein